MKQREKEEEGSIIQAGFKGNGSAILKSRLTPRVAFSDSMTKLWREDWLLKNKAYIYGIFST